MKFKKILKLLISNLLNDLQDDKVDDFINLLNDICDFINEVRDEL